MKKFLLLIVSFNLLTEFAVVCNGQTNVSGGIYADTTWTLANSPYIVIGDVVVFPNITLTIEPGVTVKFNNGTGIEIRQSSLMAEGTNTDSIIFTSSSGTPTAGIWRSIYLNNNLYSHFYYCRIQYADTGITDLNSSINTTIINHSHFLNTHAGYWGNNGGKALIDSSLFNNNTYGIHGHVYAYVNACSFFNNNGGIYSGAAVTNKNCIFKHNQTAILSGGNSGNINCIIDSNTTGIVLTNVYDTIMGCEIKHTTSDGIHISTTFATFANQITQNDIEFNGIGINTERQYDYIHCNKICNNSNYDFYNGESSAINIPNNYWCTSDSSFIETKIYDGYDNINLGIVYFMPADTLQCYLTTAIEKENFDTLSFVLFPNPVQDILNLSLREGNFNGVIKIYNLLGELEFSSTIVHTQTIIDVSNLPTGIHIIEISNKKNIGRQKFIRQTNCR